jgi:hypothetical protein
MPASGHCVELEVLGISEESIQGRVVREASRHMVCSYLALDVDTPEGYVSDSLHRWARLCDIHLPGSQVRRVLWTNQRTSLLSLLLIQELDGRLMVFKSKLLG